MTPAAADTLRKRELAQIHIAKSALRLSDDEYRDLLWAIARVRSAADLDWTGRKRVLNHFHKLGWRNDSGRPTDPHSRKIRALWLTLRDAGALHDASERALRHFVRRTVHVDRLEWLDGKQVSVVIEALKAWIRRVEGSTAHE